MNKIELVRIPNTDIYTSKHGHTMQREYGKTPNDNDMNGRWVLRDNDGVMLEFSRYRSDIMEFNSMTLIDDYEKDA